jgi:hypothetical protein
MKKAGGGFAQRAEEVGEEGKAERRQQSCAGMEFGNEESIPC